MQIILNANERDTLNNLLVGTFNTSFKEIAMSSANVMKIEYRKDISACTDTEMVITIDDRYVIGMYGEMNKWLPFIVMSTKSLIASVKAFGNAMDDKEQSLFKEIGGESK